MSGASEKVSEMDGERGKVVGAGRNVKGVEVAI
jgi:hypothetical protein